MGDRGAAGGREAGLPVHIVYADGSPKRLSKITAPLSIFLWRRRVARKFAHLIKQGLGWSEANSRPYLARKPDHDGQRALVLAAAYTEHPKFARPTDVPETNESDPAYAASANDYVQSMICILECHMFLPSDESFLIAVPDAVGIDRVATSTANLAWALESINRAHWNADEPQIAAWARRGPTSQRVMAVEHGKLVDDVAPPLSTNPFEHTAQFAFALYSDALTFSRTHRLPILTDE
jgi:hypothetical protein